mmetsp:Transcript_10634/g.31978  ORF Transcript_10634/g.31978 Transcript_10634/m.31978 type:complete len:170 (+) Transcript_10634:152-661(+)|eukprot:CAMPEP_0206135016 /NCGR_PEP_ID=MMETSP1473-20131121/391_1 /ASSEMBLY_ACC=CAM_ASM_001109 /TAXON_ID=1461547 /ORGANISM="Stichococcus sp, Strain RCC1054" /LENGTH=169 /DNA_ID=CAMNT_0053526705 /DNA_START=134 /DNA_END=643 /DNA_ORIENTATION=-
MLSFGPNQRTIIARSGPAHRQFHFIHSVRPRLQPSGAQSRDDDRPSRQELIKTLPQVRPPADPPQSVEVQHSSSYLYRRRQEELGRSIDEDYREQAQLPLPEKSLEEERQETRAAAAKGVSKAAQATVNVGRGLLKVALPVSGWAVKQGLNAVSQAVDRARENQRNQRD